VVELKTAGTGREQQEVRLGRGEGQIKPE
jgi:hypothetical protein